MKIEKGDIVIVAGHIVSEWRYDDEAIIKKWNKIVYPEPKRMMAVGQSIRKEGRYVDADFSYTYDGEEKFSPAYICPSKILNVVMCTVYDHKSYRKPVPVLDEQIISKEEQ